MMIKTERVKRALDDEGMFATPGAYVLCDGQFGSTGKGVIAALLARMYSDKVDLVTCNAGPNSGHTSYGPDGVARVLCQWPTFGVTAYLDHGWHGHIQMNAGAVIDIDRLNMEYEKFGLDSLFLDTSVHPEAAVATDLAKSVEKELVESIGSTGKGTGAAIASKVLRDPGAVAKFHHGKIAPPVTPLFGRYGTVFVEVSQGFSLSLNASGFYPYVTSRDCTVAQALSDAGIHPHDLRKTVMTVRTFPIRVGGNSGGCYEDQREIQWADIGQVPELTTVTKKQRRIFTWSPTQFAAACRANRPDVIFVNFMNYLPPHVNRNSWVRINVVGPAWEATGKKPTVLLGYGPKATDVELYED